MLHNLESVKNRIPNLTGLRFILALLVIIFHIPEFYKNQSLPYFNDWAIFHKGTEAVYVFFTLSGFLIIKQLYKEKLTTNSINIKAFYLKRALRIFPLYYLVLIFGLIYYQLILPYLGFYHNNDYNLISGILLSITFFSNIFKTYSPGGILEILWSIGIEEQFYLLIAPVALTLPAKRLIKFLTVFTLVYFFIYYSDQIPFLARYDMLFFYFSFGGLISILLDYQSLKKFIKKFTVPILIFFVLYFTTSLFKRNFNSVLYNFTSMLLFGFTLAALAQNKLKLTDNKIINYLGKISYGLYMYHAIAIHIIAYLYINYIKKHDLSDTMVVLIVNLSTILVTIIFAHYSYKYFESYFLKMKPKH